MSSFDSLPYLFVAELPACLKKLCLVYFLIPENFSFVVSSFLVVFTAIKKYALGSTLTQLSFTSLLHMNEMNELVFTNEIRK